MTPKDTNVEKIGLPFLMHFAEAIPDRKRHKIRYDASRQISQVFIDGRWIDSSDALAEDQNDTTITATRNETTDDV
jgi:hypothetical protein